jgi:hypothetical protein
MDITHWDYQRVKDYSLWRIRTYSKLVPSGCIEWQRSKGKQGYGHINVTFEDRKPRAAYAHRLLWELTHDVELGRNECVCHKCDNPSCVSIDHLFLGSRKDNSQDMARKGRSGIKKGQKLSPERIAAMKGVKRKPHTRVKKFTDDQIRAIRNATGKLAHIAEEYGTTASYVCRIRRGFRKALVQ